MTIASYLEGRCSLHDIRRGSIPSLLGLKNSSKALRRYDAFVSGEYHDADMLDRIRGSPLLYGTGFEEALAFSIAAQKHEREEQALHMELRRRRSFVRHIHVEHERTRPEHPFFVIAMLGIDHFKRIDLPREAHATTDVRRFLELCSTTIRTVSEEGIAPQVQRGPFGAPVAFVCRFTYDISFIYDVASASFNDVRTVAPFAHKATLQLHGNIIPPTLFSTDRNDTNE